MNERELPGLKHIRATPLLLRQLLDGMTEEEAAWKPSPQRFSVLEVLGHLCHVESRGFRGRLERMIREENPYLEPYEPDTFAASGVYGGHTLAEALSLFEAERAESLRLLESVAPESCSRTGVHGELGPITVRHLLNEWPLHDLGHIRQIAELIRAVRYHPYIGPWQQSYKLNP